MALIILAIICFICFIFGIIYVVSKIFQDGEDVIIKLSYSIVCVLSFVLSIFCIVIHYENKPTAMDVYRGRTTLEITYKNGVPVDSVVIKKK